MIPEVLLDSGLLLNRQDVVGLQLLVFGEDLAMRRREVPHVCLPFRFRREEQVWPRHGH